jgi:hypothetical protein
MPALRVVQSMPLSSGGFESNPIVADWRAAGRGVSLYVGAVFCPRRTKTPEIDRRATGVADMMRIVCSAGQYLFRWQHTELASRTRGGNFLLSASRSRLSALAPTFHVARFQMRGAKRRSAELGPES